MKKEISESAIRKLFAKATAREIRQAKAAWNEVLNTIRLELEATRKGDKRELSSSRGSER
jgi:hypothetical protein